MQIIPTRLVCALIASCAAYAQPAPKEIILHTFGARLEKGAHPYGGLVRDAAGNLYGATQYGGISQCYGPGGCGLVFELDPAGKETVLYRFTGNADGGVPYSGVTVDAAGNIYGTTLFGGGNPTYGVVFKVGRDRKQTILHTFAGPDGAYPYGALTRVAGNLYGTTASGSASEGEVFKIDRKGHFEVLHSFGGSDGAGPQAGVVLDSAGNIYGTAGGGGAFNYGVVFKLDRRGRETVLHSFGGGSDGQYPYSGVVLDAAGNLYGTTTQGGSAGVGVVYKVDPAGRETVLYSFSGGSDGAAPYGGLTLDAAGNLYGTTTGGGPSGGGVVFELDSAGNETVLYAFTGGADGNSPYAGVIADSAGNLYGTTLNGGSGDPATSQGVVYRVDPAHQETVLLAFKGAFDGANPYDGVTRDQAGNLYGATVQGGTSGGSGVIYELDKAGRETVIHGFTGPDGVFPYGGLLPDGSGGFYGTTDLGGANGDGEVFHLDRRSNLTILYSFSGLDGRNPIRGLIRDTAGNLYGVTSGGGSFDEGTVYKLTTSGSEQLLHSFTGQSDGRSPDSGLILDADGNLYGTCGQGGLGYGVIFKIDTAGQYTVLYTFTGGADGAQPFGHIIRDAAGNLYGAAGVGGSSTCANGCGVLYELDSGGKFTVLYSFSGAADGQFPTGLIMDSAGNFYGAAGGGGAFGLGVVFRLDASGNLTVLHTFAGGNDGASPFSGVIRDSAGNLYGTTYWGGSANYGVVYEVQMQ